MIQRFSSCAKSAVSVDDDICEKEACVQLRRQWQSLFGEGVFQEEALINRSQLISEVDRLKRKIVLLQKSKQLLGEELSLVKQELYNKNMLMQKFQCMKNVESHCKLLKERECNLNTDIIVKQKQEQIAMLCQELKERNKQIQSLKFYNQQIKEELESKMVILQKLQQASKAQQLFFNRQIEELQSLISSKDDELLRNKQVYERLMKEQIHKWQLAVINYNNKMDALERQISEEKNKGKSLSKIIKSLQQKNKQIKEELMQERQKSKWLAQVIEEAKVQFIHSELKKLEMKEKTVKQKNKKWINYTHNQSKSCRSVSEASTTLTSAKTQGKQPLSTPSAPFRVNPFDSQILQSEWPQIMDCSQFNQS